MPVPAGPIAKVTVALRIASTYLFCPSVFGAMPRPRPVSSMSPRTSEGLASSPLISSIVWPTEEAVSSWPFSRSASISSKRTPTRSASRSGPVIVISFPRTRISESKAASTSLSSSSRWPRRATMDLSPGTRIFTWVVALAKCALLGFPPSLRVCERVVVRRPGPILPPSSPAASPYAGRRAGGNAGGRRAGRRRGRRS